MIYFLIMIYIRLQLFRAWCDDHRLLFRCRWCKNHRHQINMMIRWNIAEKSIDDGDFTMFRWNGKTIRDYHFFHRGQKNFRIISLNRASSMLYEIMLNIQKNGLTNWKHLFEYIIQPVISIQLLLWSLTILYMYYRTQKWIPRFPQSSLSTSPTP